MLTNDKLYHFAQCANFSYKDNATADYKKIGYTTVKFIEHDEAQAYVLANKTQITVCFRGTEPSSWNDIKADLRAFPKKGFHKGFWTEYNKLKTDIEQTVKKLKTTRKNAELYLTGHSLGGAMATVACFDYPEARAVVTYGAPRACTWFRTLPVKHVRVVHNNDVVPKVPPFFIGYKHHADTLTYMNYYGKVRKMTAWQRLKDGFRGRWRALQKRQVFDGLYDHSISQYCRYLKEN